MTAPLATTLELARVSKREELEQILALQRENLRGQRSPEEEAREGFVTTVYTLEALERVHALAPSVIARDAGRVVGYALVLPPQARPFVPSLEPMFKVYE